MKYFTVLLFGEHQRRHCLKDQSADNSMVIPYINHSYLIMCFTSRFSMNIGDILMQRIILKNIFPKSADEA